MAYAHVPLTEAELGPAAWRVVGPQAPEKMQLMVARGMAPLPPRDLIYAVYQLWCTNAQGMVEHAATTAQMLPPPVFNGAMDDPQLHPGVIDFLARKHLEKEASLERIVRHPNVADETLVSLARTVPESICDLLAENQQRWLGCPDIVASLYQNVHCRMSVVHRMLELADRQGVEIRLPNMEEIRAAMKEQGPVDESRDSLFKAVAARVAPEQSKVAAQLQGAGADEDVEAPPPPGTEAAEATEAEEEGVEEEEFDLFMSGLGADEDLSMPEVEGGAEEVPPDAAEARESRMSQIMMMGAAEKIRLALLGTKFERSLLVRDSNKIVAMSAIKSPRMRDNEVVDLSANRALHRDVINYISRQREWTKLYQVKLNLIMNPKTPIAASMNFLGHLHAQDLRKVARSKNIPSALSKAAKRKAAAKS